MRKLLICVPLMFACFGIVKAEYLPSTPTGYVVTCNTTTFTSLGITGGKYIYFYNPGAFDIKIAGSSSAAAANRFTVKAASYLPFGVEVNSNMYALATDTNSVTLEILSVK